LSSLDEGVVMCEQGREMTIHFEAILADSIDAERFRRAVRTVMESSDRLRSRVEIKAWTSRTLRWKDTPADASVDVAEVDCDREGLASIRDAFISRGFDVKVDPLIRFLLANHGSEGSSLIVLSHHALSDATGIWAVIVRIAEQYGREGEATGGRVPSFPTTFDAPDSGEASVETLRADALAPSGPGPVRAVLEAARAILQAPKPERIATRGADRSPDVHLELRVVDASLVEAIRDSPLMAEVPGAKVNDFLLLGFHRALAKWNSRYGKAPDQISVTVPVNQRQRGDTTLQNSAGQDVSKTTDVERLDPRVGLQSIFEQTQLIKSDRGRPDPSASLGSLGFLPVGVRALIPRTIGFLSRDRFLNTSRLSNMGRVNMPASGLVFTDVWLSAPARMPQGATMCVVRSGSNITVALRCCRRLWDQPAAEEFADLLLTDLALLSGHRVMPTDDH